MFSKKDEVVANQTIKEEIANAVTHGIGFIVSVIAFIILLKNALIMGDLQHIVSITVYGSSLVILYIASTLYHACPAKMKKVLQRIDHISIYLLIAGTYMPITLVVLKGFVGWTLFGIECAFCFVGVTFKAIFGHKLEILSGVFYLVMGWLAIFAIGPIVSALPFYGVLWLLLGGLFYTFGFIFFALDKKYHYFHAIWHIFVLAGSFAHFYLIFYYVIP